MFKHNKVLVFRLMISSAGILSTAVGGPVQVDSDMDSSHPVNSKQNSRDLRASTLTVHITVILVAGKSR